MAAGAPEIDRPFSYGYLNEGFGNKLFALSLRSTPMRLQEPVADW